MRRAWIVWNWISRQWKPEITIFRFRCFVCGKCIWHLPCHASNAMQAVQSPAWPMVLTMKMLDLSLFFSFECILPRYCSYSTETKFKKYQEIQHVTNCIKLFTIYVTQLCNCCGSMLSHLHLSFSYHFFSLRFQIWALAVNRVSLSLGSLRLPGIVWNLKTQLFLSFGFVPLLWHVLSSRVNWWETDTQFQVIAASNMNQIKILWSGTNRLISAYTSRHGFWEIHCASVLFGFFSFDFSVWWRLQFEMLLHQQRHQ